MKAEHRHELKTNELAEWIGNLPQWARQNLTMIVVVSVVVVLATGSYFYYFRYRRNIVLQEQLRLTQLVKQVSDRKGDILRAHSRGIDISYTLLQLAENLRAFAQNAKNDRMAALALIKRAEALRAELHYRPGPLNKLDFTTQMESAKRTYGEALEKCSFDPSLTAMAKFGLGLCEEELGNLEKARQIYHDVTANPDLEAATAAVQAKQRLETMADYQQKVVFTAPPRPTPPAPIRPQIELRPADINLVDTNLVDVNLGVPKRVPALQQPNEGPLRIPLADVNLAESNLADVNRGGP